MDVHAHDEMAEAAIKGWDQPGEDPCVSAALIRNKVESKVMENRRAGVESPRHI